MHSLLALFRWAPRTAALFIAGAFLLLIAGEFIGPHSGPPAHLREWLGISLCAIGCLAPLLAWKWEFEAALLSLSALAAFVFVVEFHNYRLLAVMSIPAVLFLADWLLRKSLAAPSPR